MEEVTIKKKRVKWGRVLIVFVFLALIVLLIPFGSTSLGKKFLNSITASSIGTDTVAIVDGQKISNKELEKEYNGLSQEFKLVYTKELLLRQLIADKVILNDAKKQNIDVSEEEFNQILNQAESSLPPGITLEQLAANQGFSLEEFKQKIKEQMIVRKYLDKYVVVKNIKEEESRNFFEANKDKLTRPETVNASHILVKTREEANQIILELKNGKRFEDIAKEKSLDPGTKDKGGNLGYFTRGQMVKEFENSAFSLNINEVSEPVETEFGFHVIKFINKKAASPANFEELKTQIISYLQRQENDRAIREYIDALINDVIDSGRVKILYKENS